MNNKIIFFFLTEIGDNCWVLLYSENRKKSNTRETLVKLTWLNLQRYELKQHCSKRVLPECCSKRLQSQ